jgi:hypothetical protein
MVPEIRPTCPDDLAELSRFLTAGFHVPAEASFAAVDVLRWKYFDPRGSGDTPRSYIALEEGRISGHIGLCAGSFVGSAVTGGEVPTLHMIDWLSARRGASIGASLMLRSHRGYPTGFGLGGSNAGRSVGGGGGYRLLHTVPVFRRSLDLGRVLRSGGPVAAAKGLARALRYRRAAPAMPIELRPVREFGPEVAPILERYQAHTVFTNRRPELLNHLLRYPRGGILGWHLAHEGHVRGFGLTNVIASGINPIGKLIDCVLDEPDAVMWHAAIDALTSELARQGASLAEAFGSTPWTIDALRRSGYYPAHRLEFRLRDKQHLIAPEAVFHLTPLEADYAYT